MEKVVYLLWHGSGPVDPDWADRLLGPVANSLLALDPRGLSINVADVEASATNVPMPAPADDPSPVAEVSVWLDNHDDRGPYETVLAELLGDDDRLAGYLVTESLATDYGRNQWSEPRDWPDGARSRGVLMLTLMEKPVRFTDDQEWYAHWYGTQTPMSTAIQPRTRYVRNAVARPLTAGAPPYRGIVEECWPSADHVNNPDLFYCADGDPDLLDANLKTMLDSVTAFLDLDRIRLAAMSEHLYRVP